MWFVLAALIFLASPQTVRAVDLQAIENQVQQQVELHQQERLQASQAAKRPTASSLSSAAASALTKSAKIGETVILAQWLNGAIKLREVEGQLYLSIFR